MGRAFYQELFAETGGVPLPGEAYDGAFINHPDTDLADLTLITSGVPWYTLYYKGELPASAADQGTLGPARSVPACVVDSGGMMSVAD